MNAIISHFSRKNDKPNNETSLSTQQSAIITLNMQGETVMAQQLSFTSVYGERGKTPTSSHAPPVPSS